MNIVKLTFKTYAKGTLAEVIIPETDLAQAVQEYITKVKTGEKTTITILPMGEMKDNYIEKKYVDRPVKSKTPVNTGSMREPPF